ncbi:MAG: tRNA (adenine57-N1/adenine58-N1)-methyltransferase catalytic subunit [Thermoplasmata archaeon]|jgi:tRNA (adenine57-N1/adenine58-N1)-methyltransferase|nr:tRNA (adenine57-N1/adenine58-N1)-methyltransferase catalytic subunit [Thermoplasmata archaeon]
MQAIGAGDLVALMDEEGTRTLVRAEGAPQKLRGVGILAGERLVGLAWGAAFAHGSKTFRLLRPGVGDLTMGLARKAQIVLPKDASRILFECDVRAGARIVEAGIGSGALTTALAWAVAPTGRVFTYEIRPDFIQWAQRNLDESGLSAFVEIKEGDITKAIAERDVDAVILDLPNPWDAVPVAKAALRGDGHLCAYSPLVSQVEQTHAALRQHGFVDVRTLEIIERRWTVGERGSRPDHEMLGHTAWLTFARNAV